MRSPQEPAGVVPQIATTTPTYRLEDGTIVPVKCATASPPSASKVNILWIEPTPTRSILNPCSLGHHRWAYLARGGQACGYCGVPRD